MRNFTVMFMILILFLSIFFAIFKPTIKNSEISDSKKEKTHVEKLLTEPTVATDKTANTVTTQEPQKNKTETETETVTLNENINEISQEKFPENIREEKSPLPQTNISQNSLQIMDELMKKYNNNPNAEISEEDFNHYINQMLPKNNN